MQVVITKHTEWGSRLTIPKGRELLKIANTHNMKFISTDRPTYWPSDPNKITDLLDFFVIKEINDIEVKDCDELLLDPYSCDSEDQRYLY